MPTAEVPLPPVEIDLVNSLYVVQLNRDGTSRIVVPELSPLREEARRGENTLAMLVSSAMIRQAGKIRNNPANDAVGPDW